MASSATSRPFIPELTQGDWERLGGRPWGLFGEFQTVSPSKTLPPFAAATGVFEVFLDSMFGQKVTSQNIARSFLLGSTRFGAGMCGLFCALNGFCASDRPHPFHVRDYVGTIYWGTLTGASYGLYSTTNAPNYLASTGKANKLTLPRNFVRASLRGGLAGGAMASMVVLGVHVIYDPQRKVSKDRECAKCLKIGSATATFRCG